MARASRRCLMGTGMLAVMPAFLSIAAVAQAQDVSVGYALISPDRAAGLIHAPQTPARAALLRAAERAMARPASTARERLHIESMLPGQELYDSSLEALRELRAIRDLALAGRLTGQARYADKAAEFLGAWVSTYRVRFNPINDTDFDNLFIAWDLLPSTHRPPHQMAMTRMLRELSEGYLDHPLRGSTATNNWNSHRVKLIVMAALSLGDPTLLLRARQAYEAQLQANIRPDGSTIDFSERDAIHYVVYSLEPLAMAALALRYHGEDWTVAVNRALPRGFAWVTPFADGSRTHQEFVNTRVGFDRQRAAAGVPGFSGPFDRRKARFLMALAARLDPAYAPLSRSLRTEVWQESWLEVVYPLSAS